MSLVTLIQKANSDRDAVVVIEEYHLPKTAKFTGNKDDSGRPIYTMLQETVKVQKSVSVNTISVVANTSNVTVQTANTSANTASNTSNSHSLLQEVEDEAKKFIDKVEDYLHNPKL